MLTIKTINNTYAINNNETYNGEFLSDIADGIMADINNNKFKTLLDDGRYLVLGQGASRRAVYTISDGGGY